jgi:hypothetical protein
MATKNKISQLQGSAFRIFVSFEMLWMHKKIHYHSKITESQTHHRWIIE